MASRTFINLLALVPRRRLAVTTVVYGLSLAVRFTSATGEEMEIPAQSMQRTNPVMSIVTRDGAQLPYAEWGPSADQPMIFRHRWPLRTSSTSGCPAP